MGFTIAPSGLSAEDVLNILKENGLLNEDETTGGPAGEVEKPIIIGDQDSGIIIHGESGQTLEGVNVSADNWVEVYGEEIHFSEVQ